MQVAEEIRNATQSIRYYADKIEALVRQQFESDAKTREGLRLATDPAGLRFDCLGAMGATCGWLRTYCGNIEANLRTAEAQDKDLIVIKETKMEEEDD